MIEHDPKRSTSSVFVLFPTEYEIVFCQETCQIISQLKAPSRIARTDTLGENPGASQERTAENPG
jgi:hypothetical protein